MKNFVIYRHRADYTPIFEVLKVTNGGLEFEEVGETNPIIMGQIFTQEEVDCLRKFLKRPFMTVEVPFMKMFAVKVDGLFVTYGKYHGYILEDVSLEEAAYFDEDRVQTVSDYFEPKEVSLIEVMWLPKFR